MRTTTESTAQARERGRSRAELFNLTVGRVLLGLFVLTASVMVLQGSVASSHHDLTERLETDARDGEPTTVAIGHHGPHDRVPDFAPGDQWATVVEVRWRDGLLHRHTEYVVASSRRQADDVRGQGDGLPVVIAPDTLQAQWSETQPDLVVESYDRTSPSRGTTAVLGTEWSAPYWVLLLGGLVVGVGTVTRLLLGPEPWRLTRWAWAWWVVLAWPIGVPAFLVFSGATGLFPPREPRRRMTGGASLLLLVCLGLLASYAFA